MKSLWVCAGLLFLANAASASEKASRPCTKEDLIGVWEMVGVSPVLDKKDPVFFPYQNFVFNQDSSMKSMVSQEPFTKEWVNKFKKQPVEIDYTLSDKGLLTLTWQNRPHSEQAICATVLSDVPADILSKIPAEERAHLPTKGNVAISYLNGEGKIIYRKILQKVG